MIQFRDSYILLLSLMLITVVFAGNAYAKEEIFSGSIQEGDGYQMNNIVVDIVDVFVDADSCIIQVYDEDKKIEDKLLSVNQTIKFKAEGETIEVKLESVASGTLPRAHISIIISDDDHIFLKKEIDGGHAKAEFTGTPFLKLIKEATPLNIDLGDEITIKVTIKNEGDGKATNIRVSDPKPTGFILEEVFLEENGQFSMEKYESRTIFLYKLKTNQAGTFELPETRATYSNKVDMDFPEAISNKPSVIVNDTRQALKKSPEIEYTASFEKKTVKRNEKIDAIITIKNTGDSIANGMGLDIILPDGLVYDSSNDNIEIIDGKPKIYFDTFSLNQHKEIRFTLKAKELGSYTIRTDYSYQYEDGINSEYQKINGDFVTDTINVIPGDLDALATKPWYTYAIPLIIIIGIGGWIFYRSKQYRL